MRVADCFACVALIASGCALAAERPPHGIGVRATWFGTCDASAAVALDDDRFAVGNDEDSVITIYRRSTPGAPIAHVDLGPFLGGGKGRETDIEAAARVGTRIYWIGSHGANTRGKTVKDRRQFFATDILSSGDRLTLVPVGAAYRDLISVVAAHPPLKRFHLGKAARVDAKAPGGLNIEGLTATPDGRLLIGFRNPVPGGLALLVPLQNPDDVIAGKQARLGVPILLNLGGLGVRSIDRTGDDDGYLIIAGPPGQGGPFRIYRWSGFTGSAPLLVSGVDFAGLQPEALVMPERPRDSVMVLSDDGTTMIDGVECKDAPAARKRFRSVTIMP
jgi:hypothetical protein